MTGSVWIRVDQAWPEVSDDIWGENPELHRRIARAIKRGQLPVYVHETRLRCLDDLPREKPEGPVEVVR